MKLALASTIATYILLTTVPVLATDGISASKLIVPTADTVPQWRMEFEPCFGVGYETGLFLDDWSKQDSELRNQSFATGFRFTLGLSQTWEAGIAVPLLFDRVSLSDDVTQTNQGVGDIGLGTKWRFFEGDRTRFALHGGLSLPTGNHQPAAGSLPTGTGGSWLQFGVIGSLSLPANFSIDTNVQGAYGVALLDGAEKTGFEVALEVGLGYHLGDLQLVLELNQAHGGTDGFDSSLFSLVAGCEFIINDSVLMVVGPQWDFAGRNAPAGISGALAFTILL